MKKLIIFLGIFILLIASGIFLFVKSEKVSGKDIDSGSSKTQEITLSYKNYNYYPQTVNVKAGEKVRIYLDSSVKGCYRYFTIRQLGIAKSLPTPEDYVELTIKEKGTYNFACGMGMGTGTLVVE